MEENASIAAARQEEARQKFVMMMREGHENHAQEMAQSAFLAWSRLLSELRKERKNEKRMIAMLAGNKSRLVLGEVVSAWARLTREAFRKLQYARKMVGALMG